VLLLILYVLLIFFVSSRPYLQPPGPDFKLKDKVAHLAEYTVLGALLFGNIRWMVSRSRLTTFLFLFAIGVSVAALDEMFQGYIPGRRTDITDWLADAVGVALGIIVLMRLARRRPALAGPGGKAP
jgi:VanZ family protein